MTDFTTHDINVLMAIAGLFFVGIVLAGGALLYDRFARKHHRTHSHSH